MENVVKKTLEVSRGFTYTYYTSPAKGSLPTLLLVHGFPDSTQEWADVARDYLIPNGYGVIAIDCLGYSGTSKPLETEAYNFQLLSQDIKEIVDKEGLEKVVSVGHDWGAGVAQRFYNFNADRVSGLVLLNVAYLIPTPEPFNLDATLDMTTNIFGYGIYWYWKLFTAPDGAKVLDSHLDSFFDVAHGEPETWLQTLCQPDGVRNFVEADKRQPVMPYATEQRRHTWLEQFGRDSFDAPLNYYRSMVNGVQDTANKAIPPENIPIKVPFLFFGGQKDYVCRPELLQMSIDAGLIPDCKSVVVDSGHWAHLAKPEAFGEALIAWLKEKF